VTEQSPESAPEPDPPKPSPNGEPAQPDAILRAALITRLDACLDGTEPGILTELVSDTVAIDILCYPPTARSPVWTLVTSGMSDLPMVTPAGNGHPAYGELMICLDEQWPIGPDVMDREQDYWPLRLLRILARYPHLSRIALAPGQTIALSDPPTPLGPDVPFTGILLGVPLLLGDDEGAHTIRAEDGRVLRLFTVLPLHPAELALARAKGVEALTDALSRMAAAGPAGEITERLDLGRPDATRF
jgi:hypothetical protein